jgi:hypothetical protein
MRHVTDVGLALIRRFEGFSPTIYICPAGYPTIGYGHVVLPKERARFADGISEEEGVELLRLDAQIAEAAVVRLIRVPLTDGQFDAWCPLHSTSARARCNARLFVVEPIVANTRRQRESSKSGSGRLENACPGWSPEDAPNQCSTALELPACKGKPLIISKFPSVSIIR